MAETSNNLPAIVNSIRSVMSIPFNVMKEVEIKLSTMPEVISEQIMYESGHKVCQIIEIISDQGMMKEITPDTLKSLINKSCTPLHLETYFKDINRFLTSSRVNSSPAKSDLDQMERSNLKIKFDGQSTEDKSSQADILDYQIPLRTEFLYNYIKDYLLAHTLDLKYDPAISTKNEQDVENLIQPKKHKRTHHAYITNQVTNKQSCET